MKHFLNFLLVCLLVALAACSSEDDENQKIDTLSKVTISGFIQKGPYISGTSIELIELDTNLVQTGRSFSTQIVDNSGKFEIKGIELLSPYVEIKADGFYFNEVSGAVSTERLVLNCIADVTQNNNINVNVLSTLEKNRIEFLVESGASFADAKKQAQQDVLALFEMEKTDIALSEQLNIAETGDDNSILLAASIILQGKRNVAALSELLSNISLDIEADGKLDNTLLGKNLINDVKNMNLVSVKSNIEKRYSDLGTPVSLPDFESKVTNFISKTPFEYTLSIQYPDSGEFGRNLLALADGEFVSTYIHYSLRALVPDGMTAKVVFRNTSPIVGLIKGSLVQYGTPEELEKWRIVNNSTDRIEWTAKSGVSDVDRKITLQGTGSGIFEIYENDSKEPIRTFSIEWGMTNEIAFLYPENGKYGPNLMALPDKSVLEKDKKYSIAVKIPSIFLFSYNVYLIQTAGTGKIEYLETSNEWETCNFNGVSKMLGLGCTQSGASTDIAVWFTGDGELKLDENEFGLPNLQKIKTFTWK